MRGFAGVVWLQAPAERLGDFSEPLAMLCKACLIFTRAILRIAEYLPDDSLGTGKPGPTLERKLLLCRINDVQQMSCGFSRGKRTYPLVQVIRGVEKIAR